MLMLPPGGFANATSTNESSTANSGPPGPQLTTAASAGVDGAVTVLISSTPWDVYLIHLVIGDRNVAATDSSTLINVMLNPAGGAGISPDLYSTTLIANLLCGYAAGANDTNNYMPCTYTFPLRVKSGASIGAKARQVGSTSVTISCALYAWGRPNRPDQWWAGEGTETLGITSTSTCKGTTVTPGVSGAFAPWKFIGTSTRPYGAINVGFQGNGSTAMATQAYHYELGVGGPSPDIVTKIGPTFHVNASANEYLMGRCPPGPIKINTPANTQFWMRGTQSSTTAQALDVALYGVY